MEWLKRYGEDEATMARVTFSFPVSLEGENAPHDEFDTAEGDQNIAMVDVAEDTIQQDMELHEVEIPNLPIKEPKVEQHVSVGRE